MRLSAMFTWMMLAGLVAGIVCMVFGSMTMQSSYWLTFVGPLSFLLAVHSMLAAGCAKARERGKQSYLMMSGIICSFAALGIWVVIIVQDGNSFQTTDFVSLLIKLNWVPTVWSGCMMFVGLLSIPRFRSTGANILRNGTIIVLFVLGFQILEWIWLEPSGYASNFHENNVRIFGVLFILTTCGLLAVYMLSHFRHFSGEVEDESEQLNFDLTCPRCSTTQTLRTGGDTCTSCGLRVKVVLL